MTAATWALAAAGITVVLVLALVVHGAVRVIRAKQQQRPERDGSPAELISTAYEQTELAS